MAKGGHAHSGPAPDPNALRRSRDNGEWIDLPGGHQGELPDWPLHGMTPWEAQCWIDMWAKPQAIEWERLGLHLEVALLVRAIDKSQTPGATDASASVVRGKMTDLGLNVPGLRANRWRITDGAGSPAQTATAERTPTRTGRRPASERLTVLEGGANA